SLTVFEASALRSMGYAGVITVISTLLFGLTVLPAMLAMLGPRVNRLRVPLPRRLRLIEDDSAAADRRQGHGVWAWIAARVMRRRVLRAYVRRLAGLAGVTEVQSALNPPPGSSAAEYDALLAVPASQRPAQAAGIATYLKSFIGGDTTRMQVFSDVVPDSNEGRDLVARVRAIPAPDGARVLTGGLPSRSADFMSSFRSSVPVAVLIVVLVTAGVLFLTFGSVLLPIKAVLMSLISISASFGALVWIFQQGHLSGLLGFEPSDAIGAWLPVIMFAILFGLSMDYEVLLLSRIRVSCLVPVQ